MAFDPVALGYTRGTCQVCGIPSRQWFCPAHGKQSARGDRSTWWNKGDDEMTDTDAAPAGPAESAPTSPFDTPAPTRPTKERKGLLGRFTRTKGEHSAEPKPTKEKSPKRGPKGKRISTAPAVATGYGELGEKLQKGRYYAAGRMMQIQSEGAGQIVDEALADSMLDRLAIQPIAQMGDKYAKLFDLVLPPILLVGMQNAVDAGNTAAFDFMADMFLRPLIRRNLKGLAEAVTIVRAEKEAEYQAIAEAFPDFAGHADESGDGLADPVDVILMSLFVRPSHPASDERTEHGEAAAGDFGADEAGPVVVGV